MMPSVPRLGLRVVEHVVIVPSGVNVLSFLALNLLVSSLTLNSLNLASEYG